MARQAPVVCALLVTLAGGCDVPSADAKSRASIAKRLALVETLVHEALECDNGSACPARARADRRLAELSRESPFSDDGFEARAMRVQLRRDGGGALRDRLCGELCPGGARDSAAELERCPSGEGPDALDAWLMLGEIGPADVGRVAYARALSLAPPRASVGRLRFEAGFAAYRDWHYLEAIALLVEVLADRSVRSRHEHALVYVSTMLSIDDWDRDSNPDRPSGLARPAVRRFVETGPHAPLIVLAYARRRVRFYECPEAISAYETWLTRWPRHARRATVERELARARAELAREQEINARGADR